MTSSPTHSSSSDKEPVFKVGARVVVPGKGAGSVAFFGEPKFQPGTCNLISVEYTHLQNLFTQITGFISIGELFLPLILTILLFNTVNTVICNCKYN